MGRTRPWGRVLALSLMVSAGAGPADAGDSPFEKSYRKDVETLARSKKPEERARAADALGGWDDPVVALTKLDDPDAEVARTPPLALAEAQGRRIGQGRAARAAGRRADRGHDRRGRAGGDGRRPVRAGAGSQARTRQHESLGPVRRGRRPDRPRAPVLLPPILDYYLRDGDAEFMDSKGASAATRRRPP